MSKKSRSSSSTSSSSSSSNSKDKRNDELLAAPVSNVVKAPAKPTLDENLSNEKEIQVKNMSEFDYRKQKLDVGMVIASSFLLIAPFMMGQMINALSNENPIRGFFAKQLGLADDLNSPQLIDNNVWSIGFLFPFGGLFGAFSGAYFIEEIGRQHSTLLFTQIMIFGNFFKIISYYTHLAVLFLGRFFDGVASAGLMVTGVVWMFDTLPRKIEHYYKPMIQVTVMVGILFTGIFQINKIMGEFFYLTYFATIIVCAIHIIVCLHLPESPKWLYSKTSNKVSTEKALRKLRGNGYDRNELDELMNKVDEEKKVSKMSLGQFVREKQYIPVILVASFVNLAQQISGINAIVAFTNVILETANIGETDESTLIILGVGLFGSIIFSPMVVKFPRKVMLILGHASMSISFSLLMITIYFKVLPQVQILFYAFFMFIFQCGPGPLAWFISVEIFPVNSVGAAQGIMTTANWFGNTMVYLLFPIINGIIGTDVLFIFVVINILIALIFAIFLVETLGKTPEEVLAEYKVRFKSIGITY